MAYRKVLLILCRFLFIKIPDIVSTLPQRANEAVVAVVSTPAAAHPHLQEIKAADPDTETSQTLLLR